MGVRRRRNSRITTRNWTASGSTTSARAAGRRHWSYDKDLITDEEMEIYTDNFVKPGNIHGGFNFYRVNLSLTSGPGRRSTARSQTGR